MFVTKPNAAVAVAAGVMMAGAAVAEPELECVTFEELYEDGVELCEDMWDDAFEVVDDDDGYTMWFFDDVNPNNAISAAANLEGANETCYLEDYYHKETPGPEALDRECGAYRSDACCKSTTVPTTEALLNIYGAKFRPDRCGPLTRQCESFFVHEACFYECDANNGYFRKYWEDDIPKVDEYRIEYDPKCNPRDSNAYDDLVDGESATGKAYVKANKDKCGKDGHNKWQLYKMPIKRSYCNAWYNACRQDKFCGAKNGSFFECARIPPPTEKVVETLTSGGTAGIIVASLLVVAAIVAIVVILLRERAGRPVFKALTENDDMNMDN